MKTGAREKKSGANGEAKWSKRGGSSLGGYAPAVSAKCTAEGDAKDSSEGKSHFQEKPHGRSCDANDRDRGVGRLLLVHYWKPNQAEACTEEERDGHGDAETSGECEGAMHAQNIDQRRCKDNAMH